MKNFTLSLFFTLPIFTVAQQQPRYIDSLHLALKNAANDTIRMDTYAKLGFYFNVSNRDSSFFYLDQSIPLAEKLKLKLYEADLLGNWGYLLAYTDYPKAFELLSRALQIEEDPESEKNTWHLNVGQTPHQARLDELGLTQLVLGQLYGNTGDTTKKISSLLQSRLIGEELKDSGLNMLANLNLGNAYYIKKMLDSAFIFEQKAISLFWRSPNHDRQYDGWVYSALGDIYRDEGKLDLAKDAYQSGLQLMEANNNMPGIGNISLYLSNLYKITHQGDSSLLYANKALATFQKYNDKSGIKSAYYTLSYAFDLQHKTDSAFAYLKRGVILHDSLDIVERRNLLGFQNIGFDEQLRLKKLEEEQIQTRAKIRTYAMLAGIVVFMVIASLLYRNSLHRKKANALLQKQKQEIAGQKENLEHTLVELKSAQAQLIQSEKMASLGELTAGIAHEIQNPLNFMNNFSEVNSELIGEMKQELDNGNLQDAKTIADSIDENEQKINFHGKRADSIVKGMLQHTRSTTGLKEPTDMNALAGEYLRLAYHGLRAKDNSFNATIKTDFDAGIGNLNIVPQEIGRVLLNLYNNAFYALTEKKKSTDAGYDPTLSVSTKKTDDKITITVEDNGNGIPQKVIDKIFQPFFTTKPTGQGTGLGLSLSYDIVKAHGGEITVKTKEGDGTSFIINFNA